MKEESSERESSTNADSKSDISKGSFWLTRIVFTRSLGFIYCEDHGWSLSHAQSHSQASSSLGTSPLKVETSQSPLALHTLKLG